MTTHSYTIQLDNNEESTVVFGHLDEHLKTMEAQLGAQVIARGDLIRIEGPQEAVGQVRTVVDEMRRLYRDGQTLDSQRVGQLIRMVKADPNQPFGDPEGATITLAHKNRKVIPKTKGQREYVRSIRNHDMVFAIGPAGTGKTYLAVACAVAALQRGQVRRLILARPAVEAGESLGFLPGDMIEKVNPYLRPLYDALYDLLDVGKVSQYIERGIIEIAPLAFMRGRTLNDSYVILDEAQNTTHEQMKMFLTRLGYESKAIITGDITQIDLEPGKRSGLVEAQGILRDVPGLKFVYLSKVDIVRHPLVQEIISAYEKVEGHHEGSHQHKGQVG